MMIDNLNADDSYVDNVIHDLDSWEQADGRTDQHRNTPESMYTHDSCLFF